MRFDSSRFGKGILVKLVEIVSQLVPERETTTILDIGTGKHSNIFQLEEEFSLRKWSCYSTIINSWIYSFNRC